MAGMTTRRGARWRPGILAVFLCAATALGACTDPKEEAGIKEWAAKQPIFTKVNSVQAGVDPGSGGLSRSQWQIDANVANDVSVTDLDALGSALDQARAGVGAKSLSAVVRGQGWTLYVPSEAEPRASALAMLNSARTATAAIGAGGCSTTEVVIASKPAPNARASSGAYDASVVTVVPFEQFRSCATGLNEIRSELTGLQVPNSVAAQLNTTPTVTLRTAQVPTASDRELTFVPRPGQPVAELDVINALAALASAKNVAVGPELVSWRAPDWATTRALWRNVAAATGDRRGVFVRLDTARAGVEDVVSFKPGLGLTSAQVADLKDLPAVDRVEMDDVIAVEVSGRQALDTVMAKLPDVNAQLDLRAKDGKGSIRVNGPIPRVRANLPLAVAASSDSSLVEMYAVGRFVLDVLWPLDPASPYAPGTATNPEQWAPKVRAMAAAVRQVGWDGSLQLQLRVGDDQVKFTSTAQGTAQNPTASLGTSKDVPLAEQSSRMAQIIVEQWNATATST